MKVSEKVANDYKDNSITKYVTLHFPEIGIDVGMKQIHFESMSLSESLVDSKSIAFVGCISSKFKIKVNGLDEDVKGKKIVATISTENTQDEPLTLFNGIVDSAMKQSNKQIKEIVAYDELSTKGNIDVASWYKSLTFPITLKNLRDSLFSYIGLTQAEAVLPNDSVSINRQYEPNTLQALSVIKSICQINGAFGIINRQGKFEYRILQDLTKDSGAYPGPTRFLPFYPGVEKGTSIEKKPEMFSYYRNVNYEEYLVKPVDKLTIRQSENDTGVTYGGGKNNYIIQGNMFTLNLKEDVLTQIAQNVYENVKGIAFHPFDSDNNGLPFIECGIDTVSYYMVDYEAKTRSADVSYKEQNFYVFSRELSGTQMLRDRYIAQGEEYQNEFITDLQTQLDTAKSEAMNYNTRISALEKKIQSVPKWVSVASLPDSPDPDTWYIIRGEVVVK